MRRARGLFEPMCSFAAILAAARRAARGKKRRPEVARFLWNLEFEVIALQAELSTGVWRPGPSRRFVIHDPKEREITAAPFRDRVVHHAVCAAVGPVLERAAIEHSYACRPGKGVHAAVRQCQRFCRGRRHFLKCDVRGFYSSVDHTVLMRLLCRVVRDHPMLDLLGLIVDTGGVSGGGGAADGVGGRGLPIGNLTSQYFANFILTGLDLFVLQELRPGGYVRYMDDFALFDDDRTRLRAMLGRVRAFLREERGLELKEPATLLTRTAVGVPFLGLRVFPGTLRLRRRKIRRFRDLARRRIGEYLAGERDEASLQASLGSIVAHVEMGGSPGLRRIGLRLSSTAQRGWPRFTDRGRVCGLSRSPSGSASGHAAGCGQRQTGEPRLVVVARGVTVSVGAVLVHELNLRWRDQRPLSDAPARLRYYVL